MSRARGLLLMLAATLVAHAAPAAAATLRIDGEVYAQRSTPLMPPAVDRLWQFNITRLAPDGAPVKKGEPILAFDSSELVRQLGTKQSQLQEKQRELETLDLDIAERTRTERLATAEAASKREKAARKTLQPRALVAGLQYEKLLEERDRAERSAVLAAQREVLSARQRSYGRRFTASEVKQLQDEVNRLQASLASMDIAAPRSGIMMHRSSWGGEKYDVGSQVWRGQTVAEIPDATTLAVRAELPERDLQRVAVGTAVRVVVEGGGGGVYPGSVVSLGRAVRSKSQVQPIPVIDVEVRLDNPAARLRTGQAVRVEIDVPDRAGAAR